MLMTRYQRIGFAYLTRFPSLKAIVTLPGLNKKGLNVRPNRLSSEKKLDRNSFRRRFILTWLSVFSCPQLGQQLASRSNGSLQLRHDLCFLLFLTRLKLIQQKCNSPQSQSDKSVKHLVGLRSQGKEKKNKCKDGKYPNEGRKQLHKRNFKLHFSKIK